MTDFLGSDNEPGGEVETEPLFSLVSGEGDGFMLGVAAGDAAGGAWELGYSAITEQITIIAYQLIESRRLNLDELVRAIRELDGSEYEENVYRSETPHFRTWLDRAAAGYAIPEDEASPDGIARSVAIGVAFRDDPGAVVSGSIELGRLFHRDASSVAAGTIIAAAVAASCFGQSGRDLVFGVGEVIVPAVDQIGADLVGSDRLETLEREFLDLLAAVGTVSGAEVMKLMGEFVDDPIRLALAGLLLAAPVNEVYHSPIEQAVRIGGSVLGAATGAIVGARIGIKAW
ncbi:MAG: ADP-ribosylglycohydrolase family protein, partial [Acidimicrobiia bacterium]